MRYGWSVMDRLTVDVIKTAIPHKMPVPDPRMSDARNVPVVVIFVDDGVP